MCTHMPLCPPAWASDHSAARVIVEHHDQGWVRLCNGVIVFDDLGELMPWDGAASPARALPGSDRERTLQPVP